MPSPPTSTSLQRPRLAPRRHGSQAAERTAELGVLPDERYEPPREKNRALVARYHLRVPKGNTNKPLAAQRAATHPKEAGEP